MAYTKVSVLWTWRGSCLNPNPNPNPGWMPPLPTHTSHPSPPQKFISWTINSTLPNPLPLIWTIQNLWCFRVASFGWTLILLYCSILSFFLWVGDFSFVKFGTSFKMKTTTSMAMAPPLKPFKTHTKRNHHHSQWCKNQTKSWERLPNYNKYEICWCKILHAWKYYAFYLCFNI